MARMVQAAVGVEDGLATRERQSAADDFSDYGV